MKDPNVDIYQPKSNAYSSRHYVQMVRNYDNPRMMQNLEKSFKDSWLWGEFEDSVLFESPKTLANNYMKQAIYNWNDQMTRSKGWYEIHPTAGDKKIFALLLFKTFSKIKSR